MLIVDHALANMKTRKGSKVECVFAALATEPPF